MSHCKEDIEFMTTLHWCVWQRDDALPILGEGYFWEQGSLSSKEHIDFFDSYEEAEKAYRNLWDEMEAFEEWYNLRDERWEKENRRIGYVTF